MGLALPSWGIVSAVRSKEYPVKTPISIVFLAFISFWSRAINWPASGEVDIKLLYISSGRVRNFNNFFFFFELKFFNEVKSKIIKI